MSGDLPGGWIRVKVGEIAESLQSGFASGEHNRDGVGTPHLRPMNIGRDGRLTLQDLRSVASQDGHRLRLGDVLFNNTNSAELVGKTTWIDTDQDLAYSNHMTRIRFPEAVVPEFAARQLHHLWSRGFFQQICNNHVSQASISTRTLSEVEIDLPPLAEQKRIVAKLEELTARSRRAKEALDAVPPLLDQLRQSILAAAFRGDLTADWRAKNPDVEPAQCLLARIYADRMARSTKSVRRAAIQESGSSVDGHAEPMYGEREQVTPPGWAWTTVGELCDVGTGATPKRGEHKYWFGGDIPWITSGSVNHPFVESASEFVTERALDETNVSVFPAGTLLVAMYGEGQTRGRCSELRIAATTNQALAGLVVTHLPAPLRDVIKFVLWDRYHSIRDSASGGVQPNLNLSIIRSIRVPVPPLSEQVSLIGIVGASLAAVDRLRSQATDITERLKLMDSSILGAAFRGELVPQESSGEPAAALLERVRSMHTTHRGGVQDIPPSRPAHKPSSDMMEIGSDTLHDKVFTALWTLGTVAKEEAARRIAEQLRHVGDIQLEPLHTQLLAAIDSAVAANHLDRPLPNHVRAIKPDPTSYTSDDWQHILLTTLPTTRTDRETAIRTAAEYARDNLGLAFSRLRSDGHIVQALRSAITTAIRRGNILRHGSTHISRVPDDRRAESTK